MRTGRSEGSPGDVADEGKPPHRMGVLSSLAEDVHEADETGGNAYRRRSAASRGLA